MQSPPFDYARPDVPLAPLTRYNVGGPARVALFPRDTDEVRDAFAWMSRQPGPRLILGGGSNVLIDSAGFPGVVLCTTELTRTEALGDHRYYAGAGLELARLVRDVMLPNNYAGVGALTGIPGSVGGAIFMNAGTVNGSTCALMESVDVLDENGVRSTPMTPDLYAYRGQRFCPPGAVILGGVFAFAVAEEDQTAIHAHYLQRRSEKQPRGHCCGSVFKNPEGDHAGRLLEACDLKGLRRGGAKISDMHANFIMNEEDAQSGDILWLIAHAKAAVRERFGIELEEEVRIIRSA
jgi:UDP-N-acetylmuramate dehydrogenase